MGWTSGDATLPLKHWLGAVSPLDGPSGHLWLRPWGIPRRIALDPTTGNRVADIEGDLAPQKTADADANKYLGEVANRLMAEHYAEGIAFPFGTPYSGAKARAESQWREIETIKLER